jgi:hypothetical protein
LIDKALQDGRIEPCFAAHSRLPYSRLPCFRPGSAAQAPAKAPAQTPAQAPTQPAAPDYGPLDDPAQDAHEWDFATALAKARERDSWY